MTGTDTVERQRCAECDCGIGGVYCTWIASPPSAYLAELAALREKLEAAEAALQRTEANRDALAEDNDELQAALTEARAGQAAAWEAGRDAAVSQMNDDPRGLTIVRGDYPVWFANRYKNAAALTPPADLSAALQRVRDEAWDAAIDAAADIVFEPEASDIRALRRVPTEGEG